NVFVLCYRTAQNGLLPKPTEDLAACIRTILRNAEEWEVNTANYAVGGFSAGGHLAASWDTDNEGYVKYQLPKPGVLFLSYAMFSLRELYEDQTADIIRHIMCGETYTEDDLRRVDILENMSENYPPVYIWQTREDEQVLYKNFEWMTTKLQSLAIPYRAKSVEHGPHGIGCGLHTEAEGWIQEAMDFWKE
ncbi:MAG: alpha/beta hydrolase, partial [Lachnospiraceae bacterium]|nr:alpha/beta hydrolase [Lachnospiraceae bacterium]